MIHGSDSLLLYFFSFLMENCLKLSIRLFCQPQRRFKAVSLIIMLLYFAISFILSLCSRCLLLHRIITFVSKHKTRTKVNSLNKVELIRYREFLQFFFNIDRISSSKRNLEFPLIVYSQCICFGLHPKRNEMHLKQNIMQRTQNKFRIEAHSLWRIMLFMFRLFI